MAGRAEARAGGGGVLPPAAHPTCCGSLGASGRCGLGEASAEVVAEGTAGGAPARWEILVWPRSQTAFKRSRPL